MAFVWAGWGDLEKVEPARPLCSGNDFGQDQAAVARDIVWRAAVRTGVEDALAGEVDEHALASGGGRVLQEDGLEGDRVAAAPLDVLAVQAASVLVGERHALVASHGIVLNLPRHAQMLCLGQKLGGEEAPFVPWRLQSLGPRGGCRIYECNLSVALISMVNI